MTINLVNVIFIEKSVLQLLGQNCTIVHIKMKCIQEHETRLQQQNIKYHILILTSQRPGPPDPPVIADIPDNINENQQTTVSCQADNGHPSPSFQWFIGTRNLSASATLQVSADAKNRIDATSQLRYLPMREDNGLALQCNVIHDQLSQPMRVMSDTLVVNCELMRALW